MSSGEAMSREGQKRENACRLWCQHCKAMQKSKDLVVECWRVPGTERDTAFCASCTDAVDAILSTCQPVPTNELTAEEADHLNVLHEINCKNKDCCRNIFHKLKTIREALNAAH